MPIAPYLTQEGLKVDALFSTLARLANGTFHVARSLKRGNGHHKITQYAECDQNAKAEAVNGSSTKTKKNVRWKRKW